MVSELPDLNELRDRSRVLLIFTDETANPLLVQQQREINNHEADVAERDIEIFVIRERSARADELRQRFEVGHSEPFSVVLIGKDGTRKLRKPHPVRAEELFHLIDSMPMRRTEMRNRH